MVALITGGDSGIGRAVAVLFAREGADVAIVYLSEHEDAEETRRAVEEEGRRCLLIAGDVKDPAFCREAVERTVRGVRPARRAGQQRRVPGARARRSRTSPTSSCDQTFRTNIYGYFHMARAALPHLKEGASIINTGSVTGLEGSKKLLDYSATKGAIHAFTKSLAAEPDGARASASTRSRRGRSGRRSIRPTRRPRRSPKFGSDTAMKRPAQPEELSPAYVFLASPVCSSYISGEILLGGGEGLGAPVQRRGHAKVERGALPPGNHAHDIVLGRLVGRSRAAAVGQPGELHAVVEPVDVQLPDHRIAAEHDLQGPPGLGARGSLSAPATGSSPRRSRSAVGAQPARRGSARPACRPWAPRR